MPKRIIKRFLPDPHKIREHKHLRHFGTLLHDPNLWHLNRHSVPEAFSIGLFVAFMPIPGHMLLAAALAIARRVNLPIAVSLVWINNPLTMPPLFYFAYKIGAWLLHEPIHRINFELSLHWLMTKLGTIWAPFLLGCLLLGTVSAILGNLLIRIFWRLHVIKSWRSRKERRLKHQD